MVVDPGDDGWTVTHYVHITPQDHPDDHEPSLTCPCEPAVEEFDHEEDGVTDKSFAVYHHDPRRGLRAVRDTTG